VRDGEVTQLRPDKEHPLSQGEACPKGIAFTEIQNDPDRVLHPLRKRADGGGFERVSWEEALRGIGERLRAIRDQHGSHTIGWYMGNPASFSYSAPLWIKGFMDAIGSRQMYTAGSQDVNNRFAASALMYGSPLLIPIPDLIRTDFLLVIGANPFVSHGSVLTAPRVRTLMRDIVGRDGRVVVVDPRRSETARAFEHVPVRPDSDAWLLLSMLQVIFAEGLATPHELARGVDQLAALAEPFTPEETERLTGVDAETVRSLARDLAAAPTAAVYGRTGSCLGRFGTLVAFLIDALNVVTGNIDTPGGAVVGKPPIEFDKLADISGMATYDKFRSRRGVPDVLGSLPAVEMADEIRDGELRAMFVSAGNPVLSVPDGETLSQAMGKLDLLVSIDFYVNETSADADYVLPATTFLERDDIPLAFLSFMSTPFIQWTDAVVEPRGEAREEYRIIEDLAAELGTTPMLNRAARWLGKPLLKLLTPQRQVDLLLRTGRGRLSIGKLRKHPHGIVLDEHVATGALKGRLRTKGKRIELAPLPIVEEVARLRSLEAESSDLPLRLIGLRELRSHNSWMHNSPKLMAGDRVHRLRVHPTDAAAVGVADGEMVTLRSRTGTVDVPALVTDEVMEGTVALPHGWGHRAGWQVANAAGGVNSNLLSETDTVDPLSGNAFLNGIPVALAPVTANVREPVL
jgi:formate dehydrogenase